MPDAVKLWLCHRHDGTGDEGYSIVILCGPCRADDKDPRLEARATSDEVSLDHEDDACDVCGLSLVNAGGV